MEPPHNPHIQQRQIANRLGQTEARISRQIKMLHKLDLLSTRISPENKRQHITQLTPRGERLTEQAMTVLNNYHSPVFANMSEKNQQKLTDLLNSLHQETCISTKPGSCS